MGPGTRLARWFAFLWARRSANPGEAAPARVGGSVVPLAPNWRLDRFAVLSADVAGWLRAASSGVLLQLDEYVRQSRVQWYLEAPRQVPELPAFRVPSRAVGENGAIPLDHSILALGLCAMHPDGRVRERAVRLLAQ